MAKDKENGPDEKMQNPAYDPNDPNIKTLSEGTNPDPQPPHQKHDEYVTQPAIDKPETLDALAEALGDSIEFPGKVETDIKNTAQDPASTAKRHEALKEALVTLGVSFTNKLAEQPEGQDLKPEATVELLHPHLGHKVKVKESLKHYALDQGFTEIGGFESANKENKK